MAKKSKYALDPALFNSEPPEPEDLVRKLFCGREQELRRAVETLKYNGDTGGRRAKRGDKRPWVIHGESRSGKSHLARRVLAELPTSKTRLKLTIPARERLVAVEVMRDLFEKMRLEFENRLSASKWSGPEEPPPLKEVKLLVARAAAFPPGVDAVQFTLSQEERQKFEGQFGLSSAPNFVGIEVTKAVESSQGESKTVTMRQPNAADLAWYCAAMADALLDARALRHLVILVDDVDLIEGYRNEQHNGRIQRSLLADALADLHATRGVDVIVTARTWYACSRKEFEELIDLSRNEVSPDELVAIHNRRLQILGRHLPNGFMDESALREAAKDVRGLPGIFLKHLSTAFRVFQDDDDWEPRGYDWYLGVMRDTFDRYRRVSPAAADAIERTVANGRFEFDVASTNPFNSSVFDDEFVFPSYYGENRYHMSGLVPKLIAE